MKTSNQGQITVNFADNYNLKLYGKYFTTIRKADSKIIEGGIYSIALKGRDVKFAKCIAKSIIKFSSINEMSILMDTGLNYADSLKLFNEFGYEVQKLDYEVSYMLFETI